MGNLNGMSRVLAIMLDGARFNDIFEGVWGGNRIRKRAGGDDPIGEVTEYVALYLNPTTNQVDPTEKTTHGLLHKSGRRYHESQLGKVSNTLPWRQNTIFRYYTNFFDLYTAAFSFLFPTSPSHIASSRTRISAFALAQLFLCPQDHYGASKQCGVSMK